MQEQSRLTITNEHQGGQQRGGEDRRLREELGGGQAPGQQGGKNEAVQEGSASKRFENVKQASCAPSSTASVGEPGHHLWTTTSTHSQAIYEGVGGAYQKFVEMNSEESTFVIQVEASGQGRFGRLECNR